MRLLLDTTHILPFFGIQKTIADHEKQLKQIMRKPEPIELIFCSDLSLLEVRWKLLSLKRKEKKMERKKLYDQRFLEAWMTIQKTNEIVITRWYEQETTIKIADEINNQGLRDYLDCGIIGQSRTNKAILITEDKEITKIVQAVNQRREKPIIKVMNWKQLIKRIRID